MGLTGALEKRTEALHQCKQDMMNMVMANQVERLPEIETLLDDSEAALRKTALWAYAALAGEKAIPRVKSMLEDSDADVCAMAVDALEWLQACG